jgi:iron-sulfur cluster assembly protein
MGMALDEPSEDDQVFQESGITFAINKELFEQTKPIRVDFVETARSSGYKISANLANSCGSCSC